jgi:chemotaxis protein CheX
MVLLHRFLHRCFGADPGSGHTQCAVPVQCNLADVQKGTEDAMTLDPAVERSIHTSVAAPVPVADPVQALDAAVHEVFGCMLGLSCTAHSVPAPEFLATAGATRHVSHSAAWLTPVSAILGFGGRITGSCTLCAEPAAVAALTLHLLSPAMAEATPAHLPFTPDSAAQWGPYMTPEQLDATLLDSFGEICNMIAGGWKNRIPGLDSGCALSAPTIVCGSSYVLHPLGNQLLAERLYRFHSHQIHLSIRCESTHSHIFGTGLL